MWKLIKSLGFTFAVIVIVASLAIFWICNVEAQDCEEPTPAPEFKSPTAVARHTWTVSFKFKQKPANEIPDLETRIYVVVSTATEGQAAINAHKALSEKLTTNAIERLEFLEAARRD